MILLSTIKFLVPSALRRLRWRILRWRVTTPASYARWLAAGGEEETRLLPSLCDRRRCSIDVGANLGGYSWLMQPLSKQVIAFEPNPILAVRLSWFCRLTLKTSITVRNIALSDRAGTTTLRIPLGDHGRGTVERSNTLGDREFREMAVRMCRLDDLPPIDFGFMKIDVEGHELAVLQGAARQLRQSKPNLLIEATSAYRPDAVASVRNFLEPLGYAGWFLQNGSLTSIALFDPAIHQVENFIFKPTCECAEPGAPARSYTNRPNH